MLSFCCHLGFRLVRFATFSFRFEKHTEFASNAHDARPQSRLYQQRTLKITVGRTKALNSRSNSSNFWFSTKKDVSVKNLRTPIEVFLGKGNIWIFFSLLLGVAYVSMQNGNRLSWLVFGGWLLTWIIIFSPVLCFILLKKDLKKRFSKNTYQLLWGIFFIAYPLLLFFLFCTEWI